MLVNFHMADSNRCVLEKGSLDLDIIIMAFYLIGCNQEGIFTTPENHRGRAAISSCHVCRSNKELFDKLV